MKSCNIAYVAAFGWLVAAGTIVSGACYQLTDQGSGCGYADPVVAPECVYSTGTNIAVSGSTGSGTGAGQTAVNCRMVVYCTQVIGTLNGQGVCVLGQTYWTQSTQGLTCTLS